MRDCCVAGTVNQACEGCPEADPANVQAGIAEDCLNALGECVDQGCKNHPPTAPDGYEWVLMPARPSGARAPGETGHYSDLDPEPIQIHEAWGLDFLEGSALKYLARYKKKGGVEDLRKVKFYADRLIAREIREGRA